jgi:hypothetical protein
VQGGTNRRIVSHDDDCFGTANAAGQLTLDVDSDRNDFVVLAAHFASQTFVTAPRHVPPGATVPLEIRVPW